MEDKITYTLRFDPDFHRRVRVAVATRGVRTIQDAIFAALEQWMKEAPPAVVRDPVAIQVPRQHIRTVHAFLQALAEHGPGVLADEMEENEPPAKKVAKSA